MGTEAAAVNIFREHLHRTLLCVLRLHRRCEGETLLVDPPYTGRCACWCHWQR
jgi:hypothetical protein